jgi:hypothetical protein
MVARIKQVGQPLSNQGIDIDAAPRHFVPYVVGPRGGINVARGIGPIATPPKSASSWIGCS